jgi:hypothetical protein
VELPSSIGLIAGEEGAALSSSIATTYAGPICLGRFAVGENLEYFQQKTEGTQTLRYRMAVWVKGEKWPDHSCA